jgi:hypothetical protein
MTTITITWTETGEYQATATPEEARALLLADIDPDHMNDDEDGDYAFAERVNAATPQELAELLAANSHRVTSQWYAQCADRDLLDTRYAFDGAIVTE